ncbi:hypothetical protein [Franzmannia qiaohouensis]|uniref:J domain-containing protein n=1 Tax=Franzmannia qiaohouensis TaxID=1329370 RepID=A0ABU1HHJ7_9GAMM|nr:hypothetical protein [Halomonas qiaohouensis]MDR5906967.1 hypothetical protein [Halomonas qiaohouensis]
MRDLYKRLGLSPDASKEAIRTAIDTCQHSALKADAQMVLQVESRRDEYDALHTTLCDIGLLRARLGLTHGAYWQDSVANDFSLPPDSARSRHEELVERLSHAASWHNRWRAWHAPWLIAGLFSLGVLAGAALCHMLL